MIIPVFPVRRLDGQNIFYQIYGKFLVIVLWAIRFYRLYKLLSSK